MLLNNYKTEDGKVEVTLFSLFPHWHRDACKLRPQQIGFLLAASLCEFWNFFLSSAFDVPMGPDGEALPQPTSLTRLNKKRPRPGGGMPPPVNKGRPLKLPKTKVAPKTSRKNIDKGKFSDGEDEPPSPPGHPFQGQCPRPRSVSTLADLGDSLTVEELAKDGRVEAEAVIRAPVIEHAPAMASERTTARPALKDLALLLPRGIISGCHDLFPSGVAHVDGDAEVTITCFNQAPIRVSYTGVGAMVRAHRYNKRVDCARKCFKWLRTLSVDEGAFASGLGPLLSPRMSMKAAALDMRSILGVQKFGDDAWRYYEASPALSGEGAGGRLYGGQTITYGDVLLAAQSEWMTNGLIDAALVELRVTRSLQKLYIMLTTQSAAILRTAAAHPVPQGAVVVATGEIAAQAGDCDAVAMVVNLCNNHWMAIIVEVLHRKITVYDLLTGPPSEEKALAVERAMLLGDAVLDRKERSLPRCDKSPSPFWEIESRADVVQSDGYNCGAFSFARVLCASLELDLTRFPVNGDLLRLAKVRYVLHGGKEFAMARMSAPRAALPLGRGS